jgi:hypothetical protein
MNKRQVIEYQKLMCFKRDIKRMIMFGVNDEKIIEKYKEKYSGNKVRFYIKECKNEIGREVNV